jgi:hypothetical protein
VNAPAKISAIGLGATNAAARQLGVEEGARKRECCAAVSPGVVADLALHRWAESRFGRGWRNPERKSFDLSTSSPRRANDARQLTVYALAYLKELHDGPDRGSRATGHGSKR